ncbi:PIN domain-containing protein [Streptomyces sp. 6N223]|uniref:PIN domain-containing protein n=1 Tax=Streptomyces sp. 6N223 TaxID=3457412 RepID=UPI003FD2383C
MTATSPSPSPEQYLIDASAHARILRPRLRERWEEDLEAGRVALCEPTEIEILRAARSHQELTAFARHLGGLYARIPVPEQAWQELTRLQLALSENGCHRSAGLGQLLVAATARHHQLTVLHYDAAFETLAEHAGLRTRWLAAPGSAD